MLWFETLIHWFLHRLLPTETDRARAAEFVIRPGLSHCPAPAAPSALRRHARWARFNRPPKRPRPLN